MLCLLLLPWVAYAQAPAPVEVSTKTVLMISPSDFRCPWCDVARRDAAKLIGDYPGLRWKEVLMPSADARRLGIETFPAFIVGTESSGYGESGKARIRELLECRRLPEAP